MGYNFKDIKTNNGSTIESLPEGNYLCVITNTELKKSSNGNEMINITFKVKSGKHKNRLIWDRLVFTDNSLGVIKDRLSKMQSPLADADNVEPADVVEDLMGREANLFVEPDSTTNGNPTNKVKAYHVLPEVTEESVATAAAEAEDNDPLAGVFEKKA
jgi:hypothetical protein